ncbi:E3 ubiquitin-protein ligase bre1 [Cercospora beticola]|uniref:E3 ubiquitin protein ligase n=1 Tax=Cercospora beticola TaxID=122368 RepID=A0A2G5HJI5_CERBT|nr:E3 ubiquitin-protein ligase bre1 [Cercospora beticola]PIA92382.1 E3 ubiquitin-protein ligase bre1 [Cercospora beticola]WPB05731.1 hypothetical protein RHO25_010385 [Cercospora beticola]
MPATKAAPPAFPSLSKIEMEDRKRSLINDVEDLAPSRKRLKDENCATMRMDDDKEKQVEDYQKDALIRQLKEYKRVKRDAEEQLAELQRKARYHDDHLRILDAWWSQLLDEIRLRIGDELPTPPPSATSAVGEEIYNKALNFDDVESFSEHLKARSTNIKNAIRDLFAKLPSASNPGEEELQKRLAELLVREKEHAVELKKAIDEKESMYERLEAAMGRYMTAERKLDRAKSSQVQKLERQAIMGSNGDGASPTTSKVAATPKREHADTNGELENGVDIAEAEALRKEALAVAEKQRAQVEEIEAENERLTNELSAARTKLASLSDDDYMETSHYKILKSMYEDVVKRVNDLEAFNKQLREETQKLQSERAATRTQVEEETRSHVSEVEAANARAETDLARIRHARDQLHSELAILKASEDGPKSSLTLAKEVAEAKDSRIAALESQVQRLQLQIGEIEAAGTDLDGMDMDALKSKVQTLTNQYSLLANELPSLEAAWRKLQTTANKKIEDIANWEDQLARLAAEKAKADHKYFGAMKAKDTQEAQLRMAKSQNARSSEIVTQLKDESAKAKEVCSNYERQLADSKEAFTKLEQQYRTAEQKLKEVSSANDGLKKSAEELKSLVSAKDKEVVGTAKAKRQAEEDLEKCKARLDETKKQYDTLRKSRAAVNAADSDDWRKVAICPVCSANIRNTVLKTCGHVFCSNCVRDLISNRNRKCPSCARSFGVNDHQTIHLTA